MRSRSSNFVAAQILLLGCVTALTWSHVARAHDGGFGHSRRTLFISATEQAFELEYRIQQEPAEALVEMTHMDADHDGEITPAERDAHLAKRAAEVAAQLIVRDNSGNRLKAVSVGQTLGHNRVQLFRFSVATSHSSLVVEDHNFPHKPGVVRIEVANGVAAELAEPTDLSHADRVPLLVRRLATE